MMELSPDNEFIMFDMRLQVLATYQITVAVQYSPWGPAIPLLPFQNWFYTTSMMILLHTQPFHGDLHLRQQV